MKIPEFLKLDEQFIYSGDKGYRISRLIDLSKEFTIVEIPIDFLDLSGTKYGITMREMVMHMKTTLNANLEFPIILGEDGDLLDGRHRIMRALLEGNKTIKAVRFEENPEPDIYRD